MSDGMGREPAYLSSHATNRYFIPNWGTILFSNMSLRDSIIHSPVRCGFTDAEIHHGLPINHFI